MSALTPSIVLTVFLAFCRIGGCLLVVPGFSSPRILMRARLFIAIAVSLALTPLLQEDVQPAVENAQPITLLGLMLSESLKGVLIGLLGRFFFLALETMTVAIANAIGLVSPLGAPLEGDEAQPSVSALVSMAAVLLIFVTDLHWEIFRGLAASYKVMPVRQSFDPRVSLVQLTDDATRTFLFTIRIAAPFLVFAVVSNLAIGLVNKLVPQIPVAFLAPPFLLTGGMFILYFIIGPALDLFNSTFAAWLRTG